MDERQIRVQFLKLFGETARYRHRYEVFSDFVAMGAYALHNAFLKHQPFEEDYLQIIHRYERADQERFPEMLHLVVEGLECRPHDFLGSVFMELNLGNGRTGQFFTPFELCRLMSRMLVGDKPAFNEAGFIMLNEPAVGAGGMVIALFEHLLELGFNPQQVMWAMCTDVDATVARMCYIQLSLLHVPAIVEIGNALDPAGSRTQLRTPAHMLGFWEGKIRHFAASSPSETADPFAELRAAAGRAGTGTPKAARAATGKRGQVDMFDLFAAPTPS